jgi:hypothetical protein
MEISNLLVALYSEKIVEETTGCFACRQQLVAEPATQTS